MIKQGEELIAGQKTGQAGYSRGPQQKRSTEKQNKKQSTEAAGSRRGSKQAGALSTEQARRGSAEARSRSRTRSREQVRQGRDLEQQRQSKEEAGKAKKRVNRQGRKKGEARGTEQPGRQSTGGKKKPPVREAFTGRESGYAFSSSQCVIRWLAIPYSIACCGPIQ